MTEIRCVKCGRLLFKAKWWEGVLEIQCGKCGYKNFLQDYGNRLRPSEMEDVIQRNIAVACKK